MRKNDSAYTPVYTDDGGLLDIRVNLGGRELVMLGEAGKARELSILPDFASCSPAGRLPVLLGSGLGHALKELVAFLEREQGPDFHLAVLDKESSLLKLTGLRAAYAKYKNLVWVDEPDSTNALLLLGKWQLEHAGKAFLPVANPFYLRLDRPYYGRLRDALAASASYDFWSRADYPKFKDAKPRILLITSKYFLIGEMEAACKRMGLSYSLLTVPDQKIGLTEFLEQLLSALVTFRPDFALTINHLGVDREGVLQNFLAKVKLPLASWFVDNPHLILYHYHNLVSPWTAVFTWDADNLSSLRKMGFEHVFYLPLGTDHTRFVPQDAGSLRKISQEWPAWPADVSFVGNSMLLKVQKRLEQIQPSAFMLENFHKTAAGFAASNERSVRDYLRQEAPEQYRAFLELGVMERQLGYEAGLTWEATLQYRLSCVRQTLPFKPLIVGDPGWFELLPRRDGKPEGWRYFHELTYYTDLPLFYPLSKINFNCTSKQMKGAVNQRIFDVPAAGAFIITDWREQIEKLFEPGKEVVCFHSPEEVPDLIRHYLEHPAEREKIIKAAHKRVMAQHRYENRLTELIAVMRKTFGPASFAR
ncbi:MAG: glycosyltransferase [Deltaproteobacteria bacterium]|jgi:spore maturation protein CgeB|nr:glycosyltransferase [Deltaproteobacteria bacterium]